MWWHEGFKGGFALNAMHMNINEGEVEGEDLQRVVCVKQGFPTVFVS